MQTHGFLSACGSPTVMTRGNPEERRIPMHAYEVVLIVHPDQDENALTALIDKVKSWIVDAGGTIVKVDIWGRKRMAYTIRKQREGQYVLVQANIAPQNTAELERNLRFLEPVMRFLIKSLE
jgi:small subunit ribosomal protein S6